MNKKLSSNAPMQRMLAFEQSLCYKLQNALHILFPSLNDMPLTETALIFASRLVICLKYCSGAMA